MRLGIALALLMIVNLPFQPQPIALGAWRYARPNAIREPNSDTLRDRNALARVCLNISNVNGLSFFNPKKESVNRGREIRLRLCNKRLKSPSHLGVSQIDSG